MVDVAALGKAADLLRKARGLDPERLEVRRQLAEVLYHVSPGPEAREEFLWLSDYHRRQKNLVEARLQLERYLEVQQDDLGVQQRLAELHLEAGDTASATTILATVAEQHRAQGNPAQAQQALEKALEHDPSRTDLRKTLIAMHEEIGARQEVFSERFSLAETLLTQGKRDEAREECRRLQSEVKGNKLYLERLADLCLRLEERSLAYSLFLELAHQEARAGRAGAAIACNRKAQEISPEEQAPYELLTDLYLQMDSKEEATSQLRELANLHRRKKSLSHLTTTLRRLLAVEEGDTAAREELILCLERQENVEAVQEERTRLARILRRQGRSDEALQQYHRILDKSPFLVPLICEAATLQQEMGLPEAALQFYLDQAQSLDRLGARPEAEQLLLRALEIDAERIETLEQLADLYRRMERSEAATQRYEQLRDLYLQRGQREDAIRQQKTIVQLAPHQTDARRKLVALHLEQGEADQAAEVLTETAGRLIASGQSEEAEQLLEEIRPRLSEEPVLRQALIRFYREHNRYGQAAELQVSLADQLLAEGRSEEAAAELSQALPHSSDPVPVLQKLITLYEQQGEASKQIEFLRRLAEHHRKARHWQPLVKTYRRLLKFKPDDPDALRGVAEGCFALDDTAGASKASARLADLLVEQGRAKEAAELYRQVLDVEPDNLDVRQKRVSALIEIPSREEAVQELLILARRLEEAKDGDGVATALERAVVIQPENPSLRRQYAEALMAAGRPDEALQQYLNLVDAYQAQSLNEKAIEVLQTIRDLRPEDLQVARRLADLYLREGLKRSATAELTGVAEKLLDQEELSGARDVLYRVLEIDPDLLEARQRLAETLLRLARVEEASAEFFRIAQQQYDAGELESAQKSLEKAEAVPLDVQEEKKRLEREIDNRLRRSALQDRLGQAARHGNEQEWAKAQQIYEQLLEDYPESVEVLIGLAGLKQAVGQEEESQALRLEAADRYRSAGQQRRAAQVLNDMLESWPQCEPALERLVQIEESSGRSEEAGRLYLRIGQIKEKLGRFDLAIALCEKVLGLDRSNVDARERLARLLGILGRNEEAYQHQLALGEFYREKDRVKEAIEAFQKASEMLPGDARSHVNLAELFRQSGRQEDAVEETVKAAEIAWQGGHRQEAGRLLAQSLKQCPEHIGACRLAIQFADDAGDAKKATEKRKALAAIYLKKQQPKHAIHLLQEVIEREPKDLTVRRQLAQQLDNEGKKQEAAEQYLQIGDLYSERGISVKAIGFYRTAQKLAADPSAIHEKIADTYLAENLNDKAVAELIVLAEWCQQNKRDEETVSIYQRVIDIDSGNLRVLHKLAHCHEQAQNPDRAAQVYRQMVETYVERGVLGKGIETCRKALEIAPHETSIRERLADLLVQRRAWEEAKKEYENLLHYSPGDLRLTTILTRLKKKIAGEPEKEPKATKARTAGPSQAVASVMAAYDPYQGYLQTPAVEAVTARGQQGLELFKRKRFSRAIDELTAAVNLWRQSPTQGEDALEYFNALGVCYLEIKKPQAAVEILLQGLASVEQRGESELLGLRYNLALAYEALEQNDEALKLWKTIYNVDRTYRDVANKILWSRIASKKKNA